MPSVYLNPSLKEYNAYAGGGNEKYYMFLLADEIARHLSVHRVVVWKALPEQTLRESFETSNRKDFDLHIGLYSNMSPRAERGENTGAEIYYYGKSLKGIQAADIITKNYGKVYSGDKNVISSLTMAELKLTKAPAVVIKFGYHDNGEEAKWIRNNIETIGKNIAHSILEYLNIPVKQGNP